MLAANYSSQQLKEPFNKWIAPNDARLFEIRNIIYFLSRRNPIFLVQQNIENTHIETLLQFIWNEQKYASICLGFGVHI